MNQSTLMLVAVHTGQLPSLWLRMLGCPHPDCMPGRDRGMSPSLRTRFSMDQEELQLTLTSSEPRAAWVTRTWERDGAGNPEMLHSATKKQA